MKAKSCATCRHFFVTGDPFWARDGNCKRFPPPAIESKDKHRDHPGWEIKAIFPTMRGDDICGEWDGGENRADALRRRYQRQVNGGIDG